MRQSVFLLLVAAVTGCASSSFVANEKRAPLPDDCPVAVLAAEPKGAFQEVGICTAKAPGGGAFMDFSDKALAELKRCACAAGGNAVLLLNQGSTGLLGTQQRVSATGSVLWIEPDAG